MLPLSTAHLPATYSYHPPSEFLFRLGVNTENHEHTGHHDEWDRIHCSEYEWAEYKISNTLYVSSLLTHCYYTVGVCTVYLIQVIVIMWVV